MNSNRLIEIDQTRCNHCLQVFFELRDYELSECPYCNTTLEHKGSCDIEETLDTGIEVDFKTGKLKIV